MQELSSRPYHHGNLRLTVIETALEMLREEQGWQFTLREIARRAGVSHAAPYKHFPDKAALLVELAMIGFDQLREALWAARAKAPATLLEELRPISHAYIAFGIRNPALYRLMFSAEAGKSVGVHLSERAMAVFDVAVEILQKGQAAGRIRERPIEGQAAACWGLVHGMTLLSIDGLLIPEKVGVAPVDAALSALVEGLEIPASGARNRKSRD